MDEKNLNPNENLSENTKPVENDASLENETAPIEEEQVEKNDGWKFDAEAPTLNNNVIENGEFEIQIPASNPYETAPRPKPTVAVQPTQEPKKNSNKNDKLLFSVIAVAMAVLIGVSVFFGVMYYTRPNSDEKMNPGNVAMTVSETPVSIGMYNYYYTCVSQNYINYASYGYYDIDTSKPYDTQTTTDEDGKEIKWSEKFENDTIDQIQYITAYYEEALKHNVTLKDEQKDNIKESLDGIKSTASENGKGVNEYISEIYGDYCGYATLEKMLEQCYIAENYYQQKQLEIEITTEEEEKYFDEHKEQYENASFAYLQIPYEEGKEKETLDSGLKYAKKIKSVDDMKKLVPVACKDVIKDYVAQGYANTEEECAEMLAANLEVSITANEEGFIKSAIDWLFSKDTAVGTCSAFDDPDNSVVYILLKTGEPKPDDSVVYSVRHILIMPKDETENTEEAAEDSHEETKKEYTKEQWAEAEKKANDILNEYNLTSKTENDFALLAEKYSEDTESTSKGSSGVYGGLCEGTPLGRMVPTFEKWSVDANRKYGDVEIVESEYGYHIMFFVENTKQYLFDCKKAIQLEKEDAFVKSATIKKNKSALKKVKIAQPNQTQEDETVTEE